MIKGLLTAAVLFMLPAFAFAETMYITDRVEASVRSGKGLAAGSKVSGRGANRRYGGGACNGR